MDKKTCSRCKTPKAISAFYKSSSTKDGKQCFCMECAKASAKEWVATHPARAKERTRNRWLRERDDKIAYEKRRARQLKNEYGITSEQYQRMLTKQMDGCAICGTTSPGGNERSGPLSFHVDHCHKTGKVRGLLYTRCNTAIGLLSDRVDLCIRASDYLESRHE